MKINWLLIGIIIANLTFSTAGDICSKLWGISNHAIWFYIGIGINILTMLSFMLVIKYGGLSTATALVLLLTITINVLIGFIVFHEEINTIQWIGISLGLVALAFILDIFHYST